MPSFKPAVRTRTAAAIASGDSAVKAEFDSGIGIDVRRNIVVCAYLSCDTQAAENYDTRRRHTPQEIEDILSFELSEDMRELLRIQLREIERAKEIIDLLWSMLRRMQQRQTIACEVHEVSGRVPL